MYLDPVLLRVTTSSGVCSQYYRSLPLVLTYFQPFEFHCVILPFLHLQILSRGCPVAFHSARRTELPEFLIYRQIYSQIFM